VDGTLVESTDLAFTATNEVLADNDFPTITVEQYKIGCKYTTPERFNNHIGAPEGDPQGAKLGDIFDATYVKRVSPVTAGLFSGMERLLRSVALAGHPQGVLSNACGEYVRAVLSANELDEVPAAKPAADGLLECCEVLHCNPEASVYVGDSPSDGKAARAAGMMSIGVLWGANPKSKLLEDFDVLVADVPELIVELRKMLGDEKPAPT